MSTVISLNRGQYSGVITGLQFVNGLIIGSTSYSKEAHLSPFHYHENPHISLLLVGGHIEKRVNASFERLPGDIMFCNGGEAHQFITKKFPSRNINLELDYEFLKAYNISETSVSNAISKNVDARFLMLRMYKELITKDSFLETSIELLLINLVNKSNRLADQKKPKWVSLLFELLNDKWNEKLTLNEISNVTQVHPVTISKHFIKYFGCTFGEYMRKVKINKSIQLIRNTKRSLTDIALECGFADQSHFTRTFKETTGYLPKKFQQL